MQSRFGVSLLAFVAAGAAGAQSIVIEEGQTAPWLAEGTAAHATVTFTDAAALDGRVDLIMGGTTHTGFITRTVEYAGLGRSLRGGFGDDSGSFTIGLSGETITAAFWIGDRLHQLFPSPTGYLLVETQQFDACGTCSAGECAHPGMPVEPERPSLGEPVPGLAGPTDNDHHALSAISAQSDPDQIDLLVAYTPLMRSRLGGTAAANSLVIAAVDAMNESLENSNLATRANLVAAFEASMNDSGDGRLDLNRMQDPGDGFGDEIPAFRDAYKADLVALITGGSDPALCGVASLGPDANDGSYSLTEYNCAVGNLSFAHEVGHNIGCLHNFENSGVSASQADQLGLSQFGHRWFDPILSRNYRTVMSYNIPGGGSTRLKYFSNPNVLFNNIPTGVSGTGPDSANNAQQIESATPVIAAFRAGPAQFDDCNENGQLDLLEIVANPNLDNDEDGILDSCEDLSARCKGDANWDDQVTIADVLYIIDRFGSPRPEPDVNEDGATTIADVLFTIARFGSECP